MDLEPIQITTIGETVVSKTPQWGGGYLEIVERHDVDQHGKQWHSFHTRIVRDPAEAEPRDKPLTSGRQGAGADS